MKGPFIPDGDKAKADMLDNLALKLPTYAAILGVTPAEVTSVTNDAAMFNYTMDAQEAFKTHKQNVSNYKNALRGRGYAPPAPNVGSFLCSRIVFFSFFRPGKQGFLARFRP